MVGSMLRFIYEDGGRDARRTIMTAPSTPDLPTSEPNYVPISVTSLHAAVGRRGLPPEFLSLSVRALDELQLALSAANGGNFLTRQLSRQADRSAYLDVQRYRPSTGTDDQASSSGIDTVGDVSEDDPSPGHCADFDDILFLSGPYVRTLLEDSLGYASPEFVGPVDRYTLTPWNEPSRLPVEDVLLDVVTSGLESTPEKELIAGIETHAGRDELIEVVVEAFEIYVNEPGFMAIDSLSSPTLAVRTAPHDELVMQEPGPYSAPLPRYH